MTKIKAEIVILALYLYNRLIVKSDNQKSKKILVTSLIFGILGYFFIPLIFKVLSGFNLAGGSLSFGIIIIPITSFWFIISGIFLSIWLKDSLTGKIIYAVITIITSAALFFAFGTFLNCIFSQCSNYEIIQQFKSL